MDSQQIVALWNSLTPEQQRDFVSLGNDQTQDKNSESIVNFAENILNKKNETLVKIKKFIESKSLNCLIYAPTQVGKTAATREFIECCLERNAPVIVSTDNKTDQQEQMYERIKNDLMG